MKTLLICTILVSCAPAFAKSYPASDYQDAVLVSFRDVTTGSECQHTASTEGSINAKTDEDGHTTGTVRATTDGNTSCSNRVSRRYTLRIADRTYVVVPGYSFGWRSMTLLAHELPNAHVKVRLSKKGFYIRVNDKEAPFSIVEGQ